MAHKQHPSEIPQSQFIKSEILGVSTDVQVVKYSPTGNPFDEVTPLVSGISIGNRTRGSSGTLGAIVRDSITGNPCLLSNQHVLCGFGKWLSGDKIVQPGGRNGAPVVGSLMRAMEFSSGYDAALASLLDGTEFSPVLFNHQNITLGPFGEPTLGLKVAKFGARTQFTRGVVDGIEGSYAIPYGPKPEDTYWMNGTRITVDTEHIPPGGEISMTGDSGSMWFSIDSGEMVAMNFAGEDHITMQFEYALAVPVPRTANLLGFEPMSL